jgi:SHS2 domain-containing protein
MMLGTGQGASACGTNVDAFRVLEHTADIGFEAFGASREELFGNAARALISLVVDLDTIWLSQELAVKAEGSAWPDLLVNWLSEILYLHDAEGWLFRDFTVQELGEKVITATARGEKFDRARHQAKLLVKAVTYHELAFEETPQGWRAQVYVDV